MRSMVSSGFAWPCQKHLYGAFEQVGSNPLIHHQWARPDGRGQRGEQIIAHTASVFLCRRLEQLLLIVVPFRMSKGQEHS